MYADDTNLTVCSDSINNLEEALNPEMKNIHQWLISNKLTLNIEKTEYMIIGTRQRLAKIKKNTSASCRGKLLKQVYSKKTLGVLIYVGMSKSTTSVKRYRRALVCCAVQSHLFLLKLLNIFIRL
jgi:hypothetical protein